MEIFSRVLVWPARRKSIGCNWSCIEAIYSDYGLLYMHNVINRLEAAEILITSCNSTTLLLHYNERVYGIVKTTQQKSAWYCEDNTVKHLRYCEDNTVTESKVLWKQHYERVMVFWRQHSERIYGIVRTTQWKCVWYCEDNTVKQCMVLWRQHSERVYGIVKTTQ